MAQAREKMLQKLEQAGQASSCYVPQTSTETRLLNRMTQDAVAVRPTPGLFAAEELWQTLNPAERAIHVIRGESTRRPGIAFCDVSAALVHGIDAPFHLLKCMHIAQSSATPTRNTMAKTYHAIGNRATMKLENIKVTTFWQSVLDCILALPFVEALAIADSTLKVSGLDNREAFDKLEAYVRDDVQTEKLMKVMESASPLSDNAGESMARGMMLKLGIEEPLLQVQLNDPVERDRRPIVDFAWEDGEGGLALIGELDGYQKSQDERYMHGRDAAQVLADERRRESRISAYGVPIMRFSLEEALDEDVFAALLRAFHAALARDPPAI